MIPVRVSCDEARTALADVVLGHIAAEHVATGWSSRSGPSHSAVAAESAYAERARTLHDLEDALRDLARGCEQVYLPFAMDELRVELVRASSHFAGELSRDANLLPPEEPVIDDARRQVISRHVEGLTALLEGLEEPKPAVGREAA